MLPVIVDMEVEELNSAVEFELEELNPSVDMDVSTIIKVDGEGYEGPYVATPSKNSQIFSTKEKLMEQNFIVDPIPEEYIIPEGQIQIEQNGEFNVTSYASALINVNPPLQSKTTEPLITQQIISPDNGYYGLSSVIIKAMPLYNGEVN